MPRGREHLAPLEDDLQRELRVEWFSRPDAGSVVTGPDGGPDLAEAAGVRVRVAELRRSRAGQIETVGDVEHLHAELSINPLRDGSVLEDGEIGVSEAWTEEAVAVKVTPDANNRINERLWIEPLHET